MLSKQLKITIITLSVVSLFITNAFAQEEIKAGQNNIISLSGYTITFPEKYLGGKTKWTIEQRFDLDNQLLLQGYRKKGIFGQFVYVFTMSFLMKSIISDSLFNMPAEVVADSIFSTTLNEMKQETATDEKLKLKDVLKGKDSIGGKNYYYMYYVLQKKTGFFYNPKEGDPVTQIGWMYIYLPNKAGNEYFIASYYQEAMLTSNYSKEYQPQSLECFREILGNLKINE